MFIAALFIIAKNWKLPRCPSKWLNKLLYIHTMEYCSAVKRTKDRYIFWVNLKRIMLIEKNLIPKGYILYDFIYLTFLK